MIFASVFLFLCIHLLVDCEDSFQCVLPKVNLFIICLHSTTLLVTDFDNAGNDFIKLDYVFIIGLHIFFVVNLINELGQQVSANLN